MYPFAPLVCPSPRASHAPKVVISVACHTLGGLTLYESGGDVDENLYGFELWNWWTSTTLTKPEYM